MLLEIAYDGLPVPREQRGLGYGPRHPGVAFVAVLECVDHPFVAFFQENRKRAAIRRSLKEIRRTFRQQDLGITGLLFCRMSIHIPAAVDIMTVMGDGAYRDAAPQEKPHMEQPVRDLNSLDRDADKPVATTVPDPCRTDNAIRHKGARRLKPRMKSVSPNLRSYCFLELAKLTLLFGFGSFRLLYERREPQNIQSMRSINHALPHLASRLYRVGHG